MGGFVEDVCDLMVIMFVLNGVFVVGWMDGLYIFFFESWDFMFDCVLFLWSKNVIFGGEDDFWLD